MKKTLLLLLTLMCSVMTWADVASVGTVLWGETFESENNAGQDVALSKYDYSGRTCYGTDVTYSVDDASNVVWSNTAATGISGCNLWLKKQQQKTFTTSAIDLGGAKRVSFEFTRSKGAMIVSWKSSSSSTWNIIYNKPNPTSAVSTASPIQFDIPDGVTSINIKIQEGNNSNNLRVDNIALKVVTAGEASGGSDSGDDSGTTPTPTPPTITYTLGSFSNIGDYDDVILVWTNSTASYGITNGNGTSDAPAAKAVTITDNKISYSNNDIVWTIKNYDAENGTFEIWSKADATKYLYATNSNNGVRVGTGAAKTFQIKNNYLYEDGTARYLGIYNDADIRCYTSINSNISGQTIAVYYRELKTFDLTIGDCGWASMAVDFNAEVPKGASAYYASAKDLDGDTKTITLKRIAAGEVIPAGEGVVVKGSGDVTFVESTKTPVEITNLFTGTATAPATVAASSAWVLNATRSTSDDPYFSLFTGTTIPVNKSYLSTEKVGDAKHLAFAIDDDIATSINTLENAKTSGVAYNLAGQRVAANAKGIVIINGKKYINK